jgi:hypothetical protein
MDKIEGEQPNCHFTINEGDAGVAAPSHKKYFDPVPCSIQYTSLCNLEVELMRMSE